MTKAELVQIIKDNFTDECGDVDITGLEFDCSVRISKIKVEGDLYQGNQIVEGDLFQNRQKVEGNLFQNKQQVKGEIFN